MTYLGQATSSRSNLLAVWSYALGIFALVGATSVFVSHSVLVLLPIGLICVTCGIIGTYLLKFRNMNAEDGSGSLFRGRRSTSRSEPEAAQRAERFIPFEAVPNPAVPSEEGMVAPVQTPTDVHNPATKRCQTINGTYYFGLWRSG